MQESLIRTLICVHACVHTIATDAQIVDPDTCYHHLQASQFVHYTGTQNPAGCLPQMLPSLTHFPRAAIIQASNLFRGRFDKPSQSDLSCCFDEHSTTSQLHGAMLPARQLLWEAAVCS